MRENTLFPANLAERSWTAIRTQWSCRCLQSADSANKVAKQSRRRKEEGWRTLARVLSRTGQVKRWPSMEKTRHPSRRILVGSAAFAGNETTARPEIAAKRRCTSARKLLLCTRMRCMAVQVLYSTYVNVGPQGKTHFPKE